MSGFLELTKDEIKTATELVVSIPIAIIIMINSLSELRDGDQELRLIPFGRNGNGFTYYIRDGKVKEQRKPVVADVYQLELPEVYRSMQEGVGLYIAVLRIAADAARPHRTDSGGN
jgi:hypothetical protein